VIVVLAILAGGLGAGARYWLSGVVQRRAHTTFPWGTLAVNTLGAFLLGVATVLPGSAGFVAATGFLGGFTTFSTWVVESVMMIADGRPGERRAVLNVAAAMIAGTLAFLAGVAIGGG